MIIIVLSSNEYRDGKINLIILLKSLGKSESFIEEIFKKFFGYTSVSIIIIVLFAQLIYKSSRSKVLVYFQPCFVFAI